MSITELRRVSGQAIGTEASSGLFGQAQHLLGFGPMGFHTLHTNIERLAKESFKEAFEKGVDFETAVEIPRLKKSALQKIRKTYETASPLTKLLLLITGIYVAFRELRSRGNSIPIDPSEFYMCIMRQFYNRPIWLWTGSTNQTALRIDMVCEYEKYQLQIYTQKVEQREPCRSTITFSKWEETNHRIINYDVKSKEAEALAARFFNSLRDRTNVFADFQTPFSQTRRLHIKDNKVGHVELLTHLQHTLDAIYQPPASSPFVNLHKIAQVIQEL